jgi:hypothetical protein
MNTHEEHPTILLNYIPDDYAAAYQQFWLGPKWRRDTAIAAGVLLVSSFLLLYLLLGEPISVSMNISAFGLLGGIVIALVGWRFWMPALGRRYFKVHPLAHITTSMSILPEGLRFKSSRGQTTVLWKDFIGWRADGKSTLLFPSPGVFYVIPTRLHSAEFPITDLHAALFREVGPPGGGGMRELWSSSRAARRDDCMKC